MRIKLEFCRVGVSALILLLCSTLLLNSQTRDNLSPAETEAVLSNWIALDAPPGWEHLATDAIMASLPGWRRDASGNLIQRKGSGTPKRVVACALDRPAFAVTEITDSGYLRVRESGSLRQHPLWAQFHEGQRIDVVTRRGRVPGVFAVKSTHLQRGRAPNAPPASIDDLWIDVGAHSRSEVQLLGIQMLDPVVRDLPPWSYADFVAGPGAGMRVGCAAVASAARGEVTTGETIFLLTTLRSFGQDGLTAALRQLGRVDEITIIDQFAEQSGNDAVQQRRIEKPAFLPESTGVTSVLALAPRVRFAGSLVESVRANDAGAVLEAVERAAAVRPVASEVARRWAAVPVTSPNQKKTTTEQLSGTASLLASLGDLPGVSNHEQKVRDAIRQALPAWARSRVATDSAGNLVLEIGPRPQSRDVHRASG